jgi:hypothetical protein
LNKNTYYNNNNNGLLKRNWHHTNGDGFRCDKCGKGFYNGTLNSNTDQALCYDCYYYYICKIFSANE